MARSLGLTAYRALARRGDADAARPDAPRPAGDLVWIHAAEPGNLLAVYDLVARLCHTRPDTCALVTIPSDAKVAALPPPRPDVVILQTTVAGEHPTAVEAFLDHWRPNACIWIWGGLRPNLILETGRRNIPMILIDAEMQGFDARRDRWLPDMTRQVLLQFHAIFTRSELARRRLIDMRIPKQNVTAKTPLVAGGQALTCADSDLADMSATLGGRPAWFAAAVLPKELPIVLAAHVQALRLSHRLLLIVQPTSADQIQVAHDMATERNLTVAHWDAGEFPDDTTQVLISEDPADWGLFFRVAPVSFLGSTLIQGDDGCDPFSAAALGSAVLYGPKVRRYMPSYTRLAAAGAARIVNDADALGTAVSRLIAPDQAASMAHAGWDVVSQGAALTDRVIEMIHDTLDQAAARP